MILLYCLIKKYHFGNFSVIRKVDKGWSVSIFNLNYVKTFKSVFEAINMFKNIERKYI